MHGDTTSALAAGVAAATCGVPVVHVEAGLRSGNARRPFPEEPNRRGLDALSSLLLAPTELARAHLITEGHDASACVKTGNPGIDALERVRPRGPALERRGVVVTAHRRESWGEGLERVARALERIAAARPDLPILCPMHPNPVVRRTLEPVGRSFANVHCVDALDHPSFVAALVHSHIVLTDSGGVQEEAAHLGVPALVLREETERPETLAAGSALLVGTDPARIAAEALDLLGNASRYEAMAVPRALYGDGRSGPRVAGAIVRFLSRGETERRPSGPSPDPVADALRTLRFGQ